MMTGFSDLGNCFILRYIWPFGGSVNNIRALPPDRHAGHPQLFSYISRGITQQWTDGGALSATHRRHGESIDVTKDETGQGRATQRLLLKVVHGPLTGSSFLIEPGRRTWVGRDEQAPIPIDDPLLSRQHFELYYDGESILLRDLNSTNGTKVNGDRVQEVTLETGHQIEAGDHLFRIEIQKQPVVTAAPQARRRLQSTEQEAGSPPGLPVVEARLSDFEPTPIYSSVDPFLKDRKVKPEKGSLLDTLLGLLDQSSETSLYALVDGAQDFEVAYRARLMGSDLYTLFSGEMAESMAYVGPCLVDLTQPLPFLGEWSRKAGSHIGVLFETRANLSETCRHLREIFIVTDETGQEYFFRYYDPRVFRTFLSTCSEEELKEFFGPVNRWIVEDEKGETYQTYRLEGSKLFVGR